MLFFKMLDFLFSTHHHNHVTEDQTHPNHGEEKIFHKNFYGRRRGRPLGEKGRELLKTLENFHPSRWNPWPENVILDIGMGFGEHFIHSLVNDVQENFYLGVEVFENALSHILACLPLHCQERCGILPYPIQGLWNQIGPLKEVRVLFPDPWPKKKHQKRRLIQGDFLKNLGSKLTHGGTLLVASDHMELLYFMNDEILKSSLFVYWDGWTNAHVGSILENYNIQDHWGNLWPKNSLHEKSFLALDNQCLKSYPLDSSLLGPSWPWVLTRYGAKAQKEGRPLGWTRWTKK